MTLKDKNLHFALAEWRFFYIFAFVSLRWEYVIFHKGWVLQTYNYRRLSTLCSDELKSRKFQNHIQT